MPELPEVETMRRELAGSLEGSRIAAIEVAKPDILMDGMDPDRFGATLRGCRISRVGRRGKNMSWHLEDPADDTSSVLLIQVRMTGRFAVAPAEDLGGEQIAEKLGWSHVAARFGLEDGRSVLYDDVRRLGGFRLLETADWRLLEARLGPEPLAADFSARLLERSLGGSRAPIKNALLDQRRVAGIGNIYASEALHRARIAPERACHSLSGPEVRRLHRAIRAVLGEALRDSGTSLRDYRAVNGASGKFQHRLRVYDREGRPCPRCGTPVRRITQAGRSTYHCPGCQT